MVRADPSGMLSAQKWNSTMTDPKALSPETPGLLKIVEAAQKNRLRFRLGRAEGKSSTQILAEIITNPAVPIVVGLWPDETQPDGVGQRIIKGDLHVVRAAAGEVVHFD